MKDTRRNSHVYEKMAGQLTKKGYPFSIFEVKVKLHNLANKYRAERKNIVVQSAPSEWPLFEKIHDIYGKHKTYEFENSCEKKTNFTFVESDSLMEGLMPEEDHEPAEKQENLLNKQNDLVALNKDLLKNKRSNYQSDEETSTQADYSSTKASKRSRKEYEDAAESSCLNKLANTVNNVVSFMMKTDEKKSRNDAFLKVLDSYLLQLPESSQDTLKIEMLNMAFNRINGVDECVEENYDET